jgi:hypothetical protein
MASSGRCLAVFVLMILHGPEGFVHPLLTAMLTKRVPEDAQGELQGGLSAVMNVAMLFGTCSSRGSSGISGPRTGLAVDRRGLLGRGGVPCADDGAVPEAEGVREGMSERFTGSFHPAGADPRSGHRGGDGGLRHGRLHRYNTVAGDEIAEAALLEEEFAAYVGAKYCLGAGLGRGGDGLCLARAAG